MNTIESIIESIAETLTSSEYFRTNPRIPVIAEGAKDAEKDIAKAAQSAGAFALISMKSCKAENRNVKGPYLDSATFTVSILELPTLWRSKGGPSSTDIAEATARILHHTQPHDRNDAPIVNSVMTFDGIESSSGDSYISAIVSFQIPIALDPSDPTR